MFCSSVAISVEPKISLPISLPYIVAIALIFIVSYDHAVGSGKSIEFFVVYAIYVVLVILLGRHLVGIESKLWPRREPMAAGLAVEVLTKSRTDVPRQQGAVLL